MPKKTAYSRSGAQQRNKPKQKSFELVRPVSDENVLEAVESNEEEESEEDVVEVTASSEEPAVEKKQEVEVKEVKVRGGKSAKTNAPAPVADVGETSGSPKSAAARMAARRQATQQAQRSSANLIVAENYGYVRKDLIFILVLAIIMFGTIIALHFVLGS